VFSEVAGNPVRSAGNFVSLSSRLLEASQGRPEMAIFGELASHHRKVADPPPSSIQTMKGAEAANFNGMGGSQRGERYADLKWIKRAGRLVANGNDDIMGCRQSVPPSRFRITSERPT